jgi:hypothetical protein
MSSNSAETIPATVSRKHFFYDKIYYSLALSSVYISLSLGNNNETSAGHEKAKNNSIFIGTEPEGI